MIPSRQVPCETYKRLTKEIEIATETFPFCAETFSFSAVFGNAAMVTKLKKESKVASDLLRELNNERFHHTQSCEECKHDREP